jgi:hypothetical protein
VTRRQSLPGTMKTEPHRQDLDPIAGGRAPDQEPASPQDPVIPDAAEDDETRRRKARAQGPDPNGTRQPADERVRRPVADTPKR